MTNAELIAKIKAEIERQEKQCPLDTYEGRHKLFVLGELKTFLSTFESEKQMNDGLEEEIESYWKENRPMSHAEYDRLAKCARHFAQWGAEHLKK